MDYLRENIGRCLIILLFVPVVVRGQDKGMEYHSLLMANPGITGCEGNGNLRLSYMNYYPGYGYNLHGVAISYDGYIPAVHGGAGVYLSNDYLGGIVNDLRGGFSYSYYFQAGNDLYVSSGLSASFMRRGYSFSGIVLPDQIDPLLGAVLTSSQYLADRNRTIFDLSAGTVIFYRQIFGGISVSHLTQPDLSTSGSYENKLYRSWLLHITGDIDMTGNGKLRLRPAGKFEYQHNYSSFGAGSAMETSYFSASAMLFYSSQNQMDIQAGIGIIVRDVRLFYSYRFNVSGGEKMLPVSVMHSTGIALRLNNVDKRKTVKTINFPEL